MLLLEPKMPVFASNLFARFSDFDFSDLQLSLK